MLKSFLQDPLLYEMYNEIRRAGRVRSISLDITHRCNIRCKGCYYFEEGMDQYKSPEEESAFDAFIESEKARGTNFVTIVGGEPSLELGRLKKIYDNFKMSVATNGIKKIPVEGFENLPIGIAVWGNPQTDKELRGGGKIDVFAKALENYKDDSRAFWYYTVAPGHAHEIEGVVRQCIENGNRVLFNYYSDLSGLGGDFDYRKGFNQVRAEIDRMTALFPDMILMTPYFNQVVSTGQLFDMEWGYDVCTNVSTNLESNADRMANGFPFNPHFRAYNADFSTTRRCCTGSDRDCASCFDTWEHFSWIMVHMKKHLKSKQDFSNWLTTMYLFYLINRLVDPEEGIKKLAKFRKVEKVV
ncbi:MAG: radical SAM protein [Bacteroidetes bacterium]|nr:MAG: radical SAM protein [Bacteroidota bacterium]